MITLGGALASISPMQVLGAISLVLGIVIALGGLAYPSVSRKSLRATIDVLLVQRGVQTDRNDELEREVARLTAQNAVLLDLSDRKVAAEIVRSLIADGFLEAKRGDHDALGG